MTGTIVSSEIDAVCAINDGYDFVFNDGYEPRIAGDLLDLSGQHDHYCHLYLPNHCDAEGISQEFGWRLLKPRGNAQRILVPCDINSARMALATKFDDINWDDIPRLPDFLDYHPEFN